MSPSKEGLTGDMKFPGSLGCSDREMVELRILRAGRRGRSKLTTWDFRRADFGLSKICSAESQGIRPWREQLEEQ